MRTKHDTKYISARIKSVIFLDRKQVLKQGDKLSIKIKSYALINFTHKDTNIERNTKMKRQKPDYKEQNYTYLKSYSY